MKRLYEKNEFLFITILILADELLFLVGQKLSGIIGINRLGTVIIMILEVTFLYYWIRKYGLQEEYGFCGVKDNPNGVNKYLYAVPLVMLIVVHFWEGIQINYSMRDTFFYLVIEMGTGFMEEIIYRGFLFKALCNYDVEMAIVLSGAIFGAMHLFNLLGGKGIVVTLMQVLYSGAVGILFCIIFYLGKSIWPCIFAHGLINSCGAFMVKEMTLLNYLGMGMAMVSISLCFSAYFYFNYEKGRRMNNELCE